MDVMGDFDNIKSRVITRESMEGHDRTFGARPDEVRAPKRTTYVYRRINGEIRSIEVGGPEDFGPEDTGEDARLHVVSDLYMDGTTVPGPDGPIDIGSRAKRRAYMRSVSPVTGEPRELADMSDYKETWAAAEKKRQAILDGSYGREQRREVIGRRLYEAQMKDRNQRR